MRVHIQNLPPRPDAVIMDEPVLAEDWHAAVERMGEGELHAVTFGETMDDFSKFIDGAEVLVTSAGNIPRIFPAHCQKLKAIFCLSAGLEKLPFDTLPPGVLVLNNSGAQSEKAAEWALMCLLMLANKMPAFITDQRQAIWNRRTGTVLRGKRLTLIGLGGLGNAIAEAASRFGLRVTGVRSSAMLHRHCERVITLQDLDEVLPETDFLLLACPLTEATRGIIDRPRLCLLPATAGIVNIGRGPLIDMDALCDTLDADRLSGALIDVFDVEPVQAGSRLWTTRNLVMTPHVSCIDERGYISRSLEVLLLNLSALEQGKPPPNTFDPRRGY